MTKNRYDMEVRVKFHRHLYVGDRVKNVEKVKWKLRVGAGLVGIYVITLGHGTDQLEFYHAAYLKQKFLRRYRPPYIVGLAASQTEAQTLVETIIAECYQKTGNAQIKKYLLGQETM